jgi:hypothetical protein
MKITLEDILYAKKVRRGLILDWYFEPNPENLSLKEYVEWREQEQNKHA